jgi:hypothetical protein
MKLELQHLAPYLPYNLKLQRLNRDNEPKIIEMNNGNIMHPIYNPSWCKPILRSLSDLTRTILEEAGFECHIDWLTNEREQWICKYGNEEFLNKTPYAHINWLIANHYDIFRLIPEKLAIDINTLTPHTKE